MSAAAPDVDRLVALLADRALEGLSPGRAAELAGLTADIPDLDDEALDRAAALLQMALVPAPSVTLGPSLRRAILTDLDRSLAETPRRPVRRPSPRTPEVDWGAPDPGEAAAEEAEGLDSAGADVGPGRTEGFRAPPAPRHVGGAWTTAVAAAGWVLALLMAGLWLASGAGPELERRVSRAPDRVDLVWSAGPGSEAAVSGTLRWSPAEQAGLAELSGLSPNDPTERRYQLWVVDAEGKGRALAAALFDVTAGAEPVSVEFATVLPVGKADRFAITLESPRGTTTAGRRLQKPLAVAELQ